MDLIVTIPPNNTENFTNNIKYCLSEGCNKVRLNFSKCSTLEEVKNFSDIIQDISGRYSELEYMFDIPYPRCKARIIQPEEKKISCGQRVVVSNQKKCIEETQIIINRNNLAQELKKDGILYYSDVQGAFRIEEKLDCNSVVVKALNDMQVYRGKSLSCLPEEGNSLYLYYVSKAYKSCKNSSIAFSFVEQEGDIANIKARKIAKIESAEGVRNISDLVENVDGIMVARGDLALYTSFTQLDIYQKKIIHATKSRNKEVYIATDILNSLKDRFVPSRAEMIDLLSLERQGVDAVIINYALVEHRALSKCKYVLNEINKAKKLE